MHEKYSKILSEFNTVPRHKRTRTFMEIAGFPHYENVCSNILRFYLDPANEHGLSDLVINSLIHSLEAHKDFKIDAGVEKVEVLREYTIKDDKRLDLLITTEKYAIGIENKIFHHLHNDLIEYNKAVNLHCNGSKTPICIVLSLNALKSVEDCKKIKESKFLNITYEDLFKNIKQNIGGYLKGENINYVNYLVDFMKSIESLNPKNMENKALWAFFKNNAPIIQELSNSFEEYKKHLNQKTYQLLGLLPKESYSPLSKAQWVYQRNCLVHDYVINGHRIAVDTWISINGWEIQLFYRDKESKDFFFNNMCADPEFLPSPFVTYQKNERLIFQRFDVDADISIVAGALEELLSRIEAYKRKHDLQINEA